MSSSRGWPRIEARDCTDTVEHGRIPSSRAIRERKNDDDGGATVSLDQIAFRRFCFTSLGLTEPLNKIKALPPAPQPDSQMSAMFNFEPARLSFR